MNRENQAIQPVQENQVVIPAQEFNPVEQVKQAKVAAEALMSVIGQKAKPVKFNGEQYLEFEDWQTIAQFYNHTVGIEKTEQIEENGKIIGFVAKAVLYNKNGLVVGGSEAACMKDEPNWANKPLFQLRSMAQTRAQSKTLRSRFGFVAVLAGFKPTPAEEMEGVVEQPRNAPAYLCSEHGETIGKVPAGVSKKTGNAYDAFYACRERGCRAKIVNIDHEEVRMNPETKQMEVINRPVKQAEVVYEVDGLPEVRQEDMP